MEKSSNSRGWTTIFSEPESVAIKLRDGLSPQELVERVIRKYVMKPKDASTFHMLQVSIERELQSHGVSVSALVEDCEESPHGIVVTLSRSECM